MNPTTTETATLGSFDIQIDTWIEPTDIPWDDFSDEPQPENAEGWDIAVRVSLNIGGTAFIGRDSLGSNWIIPDREGRDYLRAQVAEVRANAINDLKAEIAKVAKGRDVKDAKARAGLARDVLVQLP